MELTHYENFMELFGDLRHRANKLLGRVVALEEAILCSEDLLGPYGAAVVLLAAVERHTNQANLYSMDRLAASLTVGGISNMLRAWSRQTGKDANSLHTYLQTQVTRSFQLVSHEKAGKRVYRVEPGLAERLVDTKLNGLTTDDLRLPFSNIYLIVPPELAGLGLLYKDQEGKPRFPYGIYITEDPDGTGPIWEGRARCWRFLVVIKSATGRPDSEALYNFSIPMLSDTPVEHVLTAVSEYTQYEDGLNDSGRKLWLSIFRWAMNVIVYSTSAEVRQDSECSPEYTRLHDQLRKHPRGSRKYERAREQLRSTPELARIVLGKGIPGLGGDRSGHELAVRTLVSGHWRRQVHGLGRSERKTIWIQPFWRGPEWAPERNPVHVLAEKIAG